MSGITLVFTICSVIVAGAQFALVNGEAAPGRLVKPEIRVKPLNQNRFGSWGDCYSCEGCDEVNSSTKNTSCPFYRDSLPGCVTFSFTGLTDINKESPRVVRGCANDLGTCENINKRIGVKILSCTECFTEFCNYKLIET